MPNQRIRPASSDHRSMPHANKGFPPKKLDTQPADIGTMSTSIFRENGKPLTFFVAPCTTHTSITSSIQKAGGQVSRSPDVVGAIVLAKEDELHNLELFRGRKVYSIQFIQDCIAEKKVMSFLRHLHQADPALAEIPCPISHRSLCLYHPKTQETEVHGRRWVEDTLVDRS